MRHWSLVAALALWPAALDAATFTVTSTADSGAGSLRQAIADANANPGPDTIAFDIAPGGPQTITLASTLPINQAVFVDGQTQPGFAGTPIIEINGNNAFIICFAVSSSGTTLRGFVINRCASRAVSLNGSAHVVEGNYIGTNAAGSAASGGSIGIAIFSGTNIRIGGASASQRNVISGSSPAVGISFSGDSSGNLVQGNYIGTNAAGSAAIPNSVGISLTDTSSANTISGNVISGSTLDGIDGDGAGVTNNVIIGNRIGTNAGGTAALRNSSDGIMLRNGAANNRIGGTTAADRNVISGNGSTGISLENSATSGNRVEGNYIGTNLSGTVAIANVTGVNLTSAAVNNTIGGTVAGAGNVISGNTGDAIVCNVSGTVIAGNHIGTTAAGTAALPNRNGIFLEVNAVNTTIGGTVAAARNVISGNTGIGVLVNGATNTGNTIRGNYIGTDINGTIGVGNRAGGIGISNGALNTTVGGTTAAARNIISGNTTFGVSLFGVTGTIVQGNYIGTDVNGAVAVGNTSNGVEVHSASNNTIGGTAAGAGNVISGNLSRGVDIALITTAASSNVVAGNLIGTNAAGNAAIPNLQGVRISSATANTIGGTAAGSRNVISGNQSDGVSFSNSANDNLVQGNFIGTDSTGTAPLGNGGSGVSVVSGARNQIGGSAAGASNRIWFSGGAGVRLTGSDPSNAIRRNSIAGHTGLGIDLSVTGVTLNDEGDGDVGANTLQNFPVLASAQLTSGTTVVSGTLNSTASTTFDIEIFDNAACDASGNGEGLTFAASTTVTTNASGDGSFTVTVPSSTTIVTATATHPAGNTSEFSKCLTSAALPIVTSINPSSGPAGTVVTITGSNFVVGATTVEFGGFVSTGVSCGSTTQCTATNPGGIGTVSVRVTTAGGTSADTAADDFTHTATLRVIKIGQGTVSIDTVDGPTSCGATCSLVVVSGSAATLTAAAAAGHRFAGWGVEGECSGTAACQTTVAGDTTVVAIFSDHPVSDSGFVYALKAVNGGTNQLHGFSVDSATGVLTALPGFPIGVGTGNASNLTDALYYDRTSSRLYAINDGSDTLNAFVVNRLTGALTAMPFSPVALGTGLYTAVTVSPDGSIVAVADSSGARARSFKVSATAFTPAAGDPFAAPSGSGPYSAAFSADGSYLYLGDVLTARITQFAVDATTGTLTPLVPPSVSAGGPVTSIATDATGRVFAGSYTSPFVQAFTTSAGVLSPAAGSPFASGLSRSVSGLLHPAGLYLVADQFANRVGVFRIGGSGAATVLTPVPQSPFSTGGSSQGLALDATGTMLFVLRSNSIGTHFVTPSGDPVLTRIAVQPDSSLGAGTRAIGIAFVTRAARVDVTQTGSGTGTVTSAPVGISCGATCGADFDLNTTVTLTATPAPGSQFTGWSGGGCSGTGTCQVTLTESTAVTATYIHRVTLQVTRVGQGTVTINGTTSCGATCSLVVDVGTAVSLVASPAPGFFFAGWSGGGCGGTGGCGLTLTATTTVTAQFGFFITPASIGRGSVGTPFSATLTASGTAPVTFSLAGGTLPPGLALSTAGGLTGAPTALGRFTFEIGAIDAGGAAGSRTYTVDVNLARRVTTGAGEGGGPHVRTLLAGGTSASGPLGSFFAYTSSFRGGVRVAVGDVTGDGTPDVITAPGPGSALVRVFDGISGANVRAFDAFDWAPVDGVYVAAGDVNGDGRADIIVGAGSSPPLVRVFDGLSGALRREFLADVPSFTGGVRVAAGDVNGDGWADLITAAGPGESPWVRVYDSASGAQLRSFFAYTPGFPGGVYVAAGDVNGDGFADIVTGAGAGGGPHVRVFDGLTGTEQSGFMAYAPEFAGGVRVAAGDVNGDGRADVITGPGPGGGPHVRVFDGLTGTEQDGFMAYAPEFAGGVFVAMPVPMNRMSVDTPLPVSTVRSSFLLAGWAAAEGGAALGNAAGAIHAWAYPVDGGAPQFAGATTLDGLRPDVAAIFGGQFQTGGFNLIVSTLPPGTYDLVVFVIGANSRTAIDRRIIRVTVQ